jgi:hypothetical protein
MNHADPLAARRRACETGKTGEESIETNQEFETQKKEHGTTEHVAQRLPFCNDVGVCSGVVLRWGRSRIGNRYALQRRTQIVASVPLRITGVK